MYYDMIISKVRKDVKAEALTFHLQLAWRVNFMRADLVPQMRKRKRSQLKRNLARDPGQTRTWARTCASVCCNNTGWFVNTGGVTREDVSWVCCHRQERGATAWIDTRNALAKRPQRRPKQREHQRAGSSQQRYDKWLDQEIRVEKRKELRYKI